MSQKSKNIAKAKAIEQENRKRLLKLNSTLNDNSGIYFFVREDENGFKHAYVGQARHVMQRCCNHLVGYQQHIDLSLRKYKLYDKEKNPYGWRLGCIYFPEELLDEKEQHYIRLYAERGYQLKNVSLGGQGAERLTGQIGEQKLPKSYREGVQQGRKTMARDLSHIAEKHLKIEIRDDKKGNKVSEKQFEKFKELLKEGD